MTSENETSTDLPESAQLEFSEDSPERSWRGRLEREELRQLLTISNWRGLSSVVLNWVVVGAAMACVARWPNPLTVLAAIFVIGARQLGMAILMHDAAHRVLMTDRRVNDWVGNWLCAYPVWSNVEGYRTYHLKHHAKLGSIEDPDLALVAPFPVSRASLLRKFGRDLSGRTGVKFAQASWRRTFHAEDEAGRRAFRGLWVSNAVLLGLLVLLGHPALYLLWVTAWLTTNTWVTRIRSIAEHALTSDAEDPFNNTRTVAARWWERLLISPNRVNFHLEHHLLMTAPHYRLPTLHALLRERGLLDGACVETSYFDVLRRASSGDGSTKLPEGLLPARVPPF